MRYLLGALVATLTLALVGCNDAADPPSPPVTEETPEPTPTSEETFDPTEETAEEFIRRWFEWSASMQNTGEVRDFRRLNGPDCHGCTALIETVEEIYAHNGSIEKDPTVVERVERDTRDQWSVEVTAGETRLRRTADASEESLPGGEHSYVFFLERVGGAWQVTDYFNRGDAR
jgi:hypothetical protein